MADDNPRTEELGLSARTGAEPEERVIIPMTPMPSPEAEITGDEFPMAHLPDSASETEDQIPDLNILPDVPEPILQEIHKAPRHATIRVKSKNDFEAVRDYIKHYNPKKLKVEHRPGLSIPAIWIGR